MTIDVHEWNHMFSFSVLRAGRWYALVYFICLSSNFISFLFSVSHHVIDTNVTFPRNMPEIPRNTWCLSWSWIIGSGQPRYNPAANRSFPAYLDANTEGPSQRICKTSCTCKILMPLMEITETPPVFLGTVANTLAYEVGCRSRVQELFPALPASEINRSWRKSWFWGHPSRIDSFQVCVRL